MLLQHDSNKVESASQHKYKEQRAAGESLRSDRRMRLPAAGSRGLCHKIMRSFLRWSHNVRRGRGSPSTCTFIDQKAAI